MGKKGRQTTKGGYHGPMISAHAKFENEIGTIIYQKIFSENKSKCSKKKKKKIERSQSRGYF